MIVDVPARHMAAVRVGYERYLCIRKGDDLVVIRDRCKHRGGPLSLGRWNERRCSITCPWHDTVNLPEDLEQLEVPSTRHGQSLRIQVPDPLDPPTT